MSKRFSSLNDRRISKSDLEFHSIRLDREEAKLPTNKTVRESV